MDEYANITAAARHRDWGGCARIMFFQLYLYPKSAQATIAAETLREYLRIWEQKHPGQNHSNESSMSYFYMGKAAPPTSEDELDPADAEYENAVIEFKSGVAEKVGNLDKTKHFAAAIRSTVLAIQINQWLQDYPSQYEQGKHGYKITGPTVFEDEAASIEAEKAWMRVDAIFAKRRLPSKGGRLLEPTARPSEIEQAYIDWNNSLL